MTDAELIERLRELAQWSADRHGYHVCDEDKTVAAMLEAQAADRIAALIAELDEADKNGSDWFNAFQDVDNWLCFRDWWLKEDIHPTNPAQTLITGLERKEAEIAAIIDRLEATGGHNKPCHSCGTLCNGLAGNPGLWPICLPVEGQPTWFCTACIASMRDKAAKKTEHHV